MVRRIISETDWLVVNLDALTYAGNPESLGTIANHERYVFVNGDIADRELVSQLLREHRIQAVMNFAAESHVDRSITSPGSFVQTNVVGTFELLQAALEYCASLSGDDRDRFRFLHVSTDEVYGSLGETGKFSETTAYQPNSPYSASKASSDHFVRAYHETYRLPTLITNCSNNYGPYQFPEKLIPLMILNAFAGEPLPIYGKGDNIRDWLHVEDHCGALQIVLEQGQVGEIYNIGGECELTNLQVVSHICDAVDRLATPSSHRPSRDLINHVEDRPGHDYRYAIDCTKIKRELGWQPTLNFRDGIEQTVRWYMDNNDWVKSIRSGGYRGQRQGLQTPHAEDD